MSSITSRSGYIYKVLDSLLSLYHRDVVFENDMLKIFLYRLKDGYGLKLLEKFTTSDQKIFAEAILLAPHDQPYVLINDLRKLLISWNTFLGMKLEVILKLEELLIEKHNVSAKDIETNKLLMIELKIKPLTEQFAGIDVSKLSNYELEHLLLSPRDFLKSSGK